MGLFTPLLKQITLQRVAALSYDLAVTYGSYVAGSAVEGSMVDRGSNILLMEAHRKDVDKALFTSITLFFLGSLLVCLDNSIKKRQEITSGRRFEDKEVMLTRSTKLGLFIMSLGVWSMALGAGLSDHLSADAQGNHKAEEFAKAGTTADALILSGPAAVIIGCLVIKIRHDKANQYKKLQPHQLVDPGAGASDDSAQDDDSDDESRPLYGGSSKK